MDLAAVLDEGDLARACHEAGVKYRTAPKHVDAVLARHPRTPGRKKLRRVLHGDAHVLLSALEEGFVERLKEDRLPLPFTNKVAGGRYVDCRWPVHGLTVELESYRYHNSRYSWEQGFRREREARERDDDFRRFTWHDVMVDPRAMLRELRSILVPAAP